jgi:hypothetical protein
VGGHACVRPATACSYCAERPNATLADVRAATAALEAMAGEPEAALAQLQHLCPQRGFSLVFSRLTEPELERVYLTDGRLARREYQRLRSTGAVGPIVGDLVSATNPEMTLRAYDTGSTEQEAADRAMQRWRTEQGD